MIKLRLLFIFLGSFSTAWAEENPFLSIRERYEWAIGEVMNHKVNDPFTFQNEEKGKKAPSGQGKAPITVKTYHFLTETDKAKVNVTLTTMENGFLLDVVSDQVIQGWLIKRQSTRQVFLKGGAPIDNPYEVRIRVERPYIPDFGLTLFVTQESDPALVLLFEGPNGREVKP